MANEEKMNVDIENQEDFEKKKKIIVISLSATLVFITLIAGLFLVKKNKESGFENNDIGEVVNENNDNEKEADKDKPKKIKNKDEKKSEEKNNADQKDENEDDQKEIDDLPWTLNWKGAVIDLIISSLITSIPYLIVLERYPNLEAKINSPSCDRDKTLFGFFIFFFLAFFYEVFFPLIFAIKKYKNKSYWERFKLIGKSFLIIFLKYLIILIIILIIIVILIIICFGLLILCGVSIPIPGQNSTQT